MISFIAGVTNIFLNSSPTLAQIVPDNTLGNERSIVVPNQTIRGTNSDRIDGGAIRGSNLFHSFQEFNINNGSGAYFSNPENISNILTRVTGNNLSNILGTLGVLGNANLFLINPNGIVFGPNARLDVGGSFFASTADSILFENNIGFSASNPDAPPLLTINIPIGLNFRESQPTATIRNQGNLSVQNNQTLGLIGGNIIIDNGQITAEQGRVEIGSIGNNNSVIFNPTNTGFSLDYTNINQFQDIVLRNGALIDVSGNGGGSVQVQGQNISLTEESVIQSNTLGSQPGGNLTINGNNLTLQNGAQIRVGTSGVGDGGDITVRASEIEIDGTSNDGLFQSAILADVENIDNRIPDVSNSGNGGNISIETNRLILTEGGQVRASTFGLGNAGNLNINATERIEATGISPDGEFISGLFNNLGPGSSGNGGNITVNTPILRLMEGGSIGANVRSIGDGGDITVNANIIEAIGSDAAESSDPQQQQLVENIGDQIPSLINTLVFPGGTGTGGDININTQQLTLRESGYITTGTFGAGNGGNLNIQADNIEVSGVAATGFPRSAISTNVSTATASGNGGNLTLDAGQITVQQGGTIQAGTSGSGNSGDIMIRAGDIEVTGRSAGGVFASSISTGVQDLSAFIPGAVGSSNAGNLTIESNSITLTDSGEITASTFGSGNAGNISINSPQIQLDNGLISVNNNSNTATTVGGITIDSETITLNNSAIETVTLGQGNAGNIIVNANNITASGLANDPVFPTDPANNQFLGGIRSIVGTAATGSSGDITVNTQQLGLQNGAAVGSLVRGAGPGGDVFITAENIEVSGVGAAISQDPALSLLFLTFNNRLPAGLYTTVIPQATGLGGNLTVNTSTLRVQDSGVVAAGTFGSGESGDLSITAQEIEVLGKSNEFALPSLLTTTTIFETGQGGDLSVNTDRLSLRDGGQIRAGTSGMGDSGDVTVIASEIELTGRSPDGLYPSSISTNVGDLVVLNPELIGIGNGGDLYVESDRITLTNGGEITASTFGSGDAGNIFVNAREITASGALQVGDFVVPTGLRVDVLPGSTGNGGDLTVNTDRLTLRDGGQLSTNMFSTSESVQSGNLTVNAREIFATGISINSASGLVTNVQNGASGSAGTLTVNTDRLTLRDGAAISSLIAGTGSGGNVEVNAGEIEAVGVGVAEATNPVEEQILLFLGGVFPSGFLVTVLPTATGQGGNLNVTADRITVKDSAQLGTGTFGVGNSGDLMVRAAEINVSGLSENGFPPTSIQTAVLGSLASGDGGNAVIEAQRINLQDGGQLRSGTSGSGNSGNLTVIAPEINLSGTSFDGRFPSSILTEVEDFSDVAPGVVGSGDGGSLTINSDRISITEGAAITASSFGEGAAGSMEISSDSLELNQGILQAETPVGSGGNITLNIPNIQLRNSRITTNATGVATGGSITINTETLAAVENSDITANAQQAAGGQITINADAVLGAQVRQDLTPASDITASSELGTEFSGTIEFNTDFSSSEFAIEFSQEVIDPEALIAQNPCQQNQDSQFIITGRGGLAQNPTQETNNLAVSVDLSEPIQEEQQSSVPIRPAQTSTSTTEEEPISSLDIIPARGWIRDENGDVILVSYDPTATQVQRNRSRLQSCDATFGED